VIKTTLKPIRLSDHAHRPVDAQAWVCLRRNGRLARVPRPIERSVAAEAALTPDGFETQFQRA
jgi:hypothetical protein